jgi:hypothetical protein
LSTTPTEFTVAFQPTRRARAVQKAAGKLSRQPARVARQVALAQALQQRIESGEFRNQAEMARALGFSRERVSKIMDLLLLAPDIQEELLFLESGPGAQAIAEAELHQVVLRTISWSGQRESWASFSRARRALGA